MSRTDALTQVANRRLFYHLADMEISRARRNASPFTMAYLDLDNFKLMNDRFGHRIGDTLLCLVASTIQKNLRRSDTVARLGGDEFAILLPETGREAADEVLDRLRKLLLDLMSEKGWPVTLSVGAMTFIHPPDSVDEMIRSADDLMYSVKQSSKNMIQYGVFRKS
ncbi:GGDEF domain-containing protein [Candidatus Poribacteria bacterium]|nr:GGDEF domain-containing protein [Candidatus Poribacteria bacterium]